MQPDNIGVVIPLKPILFCDNCGQRPKFKDKKWCKRCIDKYNRVAANSIKGAGFNGFYEDIPLMYLTAEISDFPDIELDSEPNLFFYGNVGTGKTRMIYAMLKRARANGLSAVVREFGQICSEIRKSYNIKSDETEWDIVKRYADYDLLFLDDLGLQQGNVSEFAYLTFYQILDKRIADALPTIISSNKTIEQVGISFDKRIESRLQLFKTIEFKGEDRRKNHNIKGKEF